MKFRDVMVLVALILLILGLTAAEKYGEYSRRDQWLEASATTHQAWRNRMDRQFVARWDSLSTDLKGLIDSLATSILSDVDTNITSGFGDDRLADQQSSDPSESSHNDSDATDNDPDGQLVADVTATYEEAVGTLPEDLSDYEQRIATDEIMAMVRLRFRMTPGELDSVLAITVLDSE